MQEEEIKDTEDQEETGPSKWERLDLADIAEGHISLLSKLLEDTQRIRKLLLEKRG